MKKNTVYTLGSLIILLICAFCFVVLPAFEGRASRQQGGDTPVFGKYNGKEIKYEQGSDFAEYVSQYGQMYQMYGQQLDQSAYYQIFSQAFNATVMKYAYAEAVDKSGYEVPASAVTREMIPYFSDENGNYSSKLYKAASEEAKLELKNALSSRMYANRFYNDNFGSTNEVFNLDALYGLKSSDAEQKFLEAANNKMRGFDVAAFAMSDYPLEEKLKFARQNEAKFNSYDMLIITVEDKSTAETVSKRLANNEITFEDAVTEYSQKNYSNSEGKLTNTYQYQIENILENKEDIGAITGLAKDAVSDIIQTTSGFSIFKCANDMTKPDFDSEATQRIVSSYITNYESSIIEDYFTVKANDFIKEAKASDFAAAGEKTGAKVAELEPFPLNYGNVNVLGEFKAGDSGITNAESNENFLSKAFALSLNEISEPIVVGDNVVVLKFTKESTPEDSEINPTLFSSYDEDSANEAIMGSDKLTNDFISVYFQNFLR